MTLPPGATIGLLGGGQLGKMIAIEARKMGYRVAVMDPDPACSARGVADHYVKGAFGDAAAAAELARVSDVVTLETEHIPSEVIAAAEAVRAVRPTSKELHTIQDRLRQKEFLAAHAFPQPRFRAVSTEADLDAAVREVGAPAVLKTRRGGYDGKGQARVMRADEARAAWESVGRAPAILEAFVPFTKEVSVVLARGLDGEIRTWPVAENVHRRGILHTTVAPADVSAATARAALDLASRIATALDHCGAMAVEMFHLADGSLMVNEIAPRVHNSGHFTFGAASATSQFEQHVRAVCGLPLGDTAMLSPAAMLNVLGDSWTDGRPPDWRAVLATPGASLHLYGKADARPGRKMGHVTVVAPTAAEALARAERAHAALAAGRSA